MQSDSATLLQYLMADRRTGVVVSDGTFAISPVSASERLATFTGTDSRALYLPGQDCRLQVLSLDLTNIAGAMTSVTWWLSQGPTGRWPVTNQITTPILYDLAVPTTAGVAARIDIPFHQWSVVPANERGGLYLHIASDVGTADAIGYLLYTGFAPAIGGRALP